MSNSIPREALKAINKKTGKKITEGAIKKLANSVKSSTLQSEAQLAQLVKKVAQMANVKLSDSAISDVVNTVKNSGLNENNLEALMKLISKS